MELQNGPCADEVNYLIIGSGFGGSVMAAELATRRRGVCLFERGKAYPPGSFPRRVMEIDDSIWAPGFGKHGMFDLWSFDGIDAVTASGLGGGSLIYANVMLEKPAQWFTQPVPDGNGKTETWSFTHRDLRDHYRAVREVLQVQEIPQSLHEEHSKKTTKFLDAGSVLAPLAVRFDGADGPAKGAPLPPADYPNIHGDDVERTTCTMCGECDVGCNRGAKSSLDHTYLSMAAHHGAQICVRTEVREIAPCTDDSDYLFEVAYVVHPECRNKSEPVEGVIRAKRVILAAGTLGSTYLMLRSKKLGLSDCAALGKRFCGNGDLLGFALPDGDDDELLPSGGPVITTYRSYDEGERRILLQDGGLPNLATWGWGPDDLREALAKLSVPRFASAWLRRLRWPLPLLGMGADIPDGQLCLKDSDDTKMTCTWKKHTSDKHFQDVARRMEALTKDLGAGFLRNFLWNFIDEVITVHPLGGCPADTSAQEGVVDSYGRVRGVPGLWITDGSVMPGPVGANPSLTIAAFARRAAHELRKEDLATPSLPAPFIPQPYGDSDRSG